jgi:hypothetical protein
MTVNFINWKEKLFSMFKTQPQVQAGVQTRGQAHAQAQARAQQPIRMVGERALERRL